MTNAEVPKQERRTTDTKYYGLSVSVAVVAGVSPDSLAETANPTSLHGFPPTSVSDWYEYILPIRPLCCLRRGFWLGFSGWPKCVDE